MKTKFVLYPMVMSCVLIAGYLYLRGFSHPPSRLPSQEVNSKDIYSGHEDLILVGKPSHNETLKAVDEAWENVRGGNAYDDAGQYNQAAKAYERAYFLGEKAVGGLKLAMMYEKLGRYDNGITLLDKMIQNGELSSNGVKNANAIKSRLLAARAQQESAS